MTAGFRNVGLLVILMQFLETLETKARMECVHGYLSAGYSGLKGSPIPSAFIKTILFKRWFFKKKGGGEGKVCLK